MSDHSILLKRLNDELNESVEKMKMNRDEIHQLIIFEELEKKRIESEIRSLAERYAIIIKSLSNNYVTEKEYDENMMSTILTYEKIVEESKSLLEISVKKLNLNAKC